MSQEAGEMNHPIYMDYHATTPVDPRVLDAMLPYFTEIYGNAASRNHSFGHQAESAVDDARQAIADLIGAKSKEIVFTSGATESDNLAIKGVAKFYSVHGKHIITQVTEHKAVLDSCKELEREGFEVTYLPNETTGVINLDELRAAIRPDTVLVTIMHANNEIGTIQPLAEIGKITREHKIVFHTDASQSAGKVPIDVHAMNIDLLSISAHKMYGPKGVGALYVRSRNPRVRIHAEMHGGGHERGMRSGTLNVPGIVGMGTAAKIANERMTEDHQRISALRDRLQHGFESQLDHVYVNGHPTERLAGNLNISFAYVEGESLMMGIPEIAVSSGSACTSATLEPSYVLKALGVDDELAHTSIRFGLGRFTTEEEVDYAVDKFVSEVKRLRDMSPLYEMALAGIDLKTVEWNDPH